MASESLSRVSNDLANRLTSVERRVQFLTISKGISRLIVASAAVLLAAVLIDLAWEVPQAARFGMLAMFCIVVMWMSFRFVLWPALRRASDSEAAALVESAHPELQERLTSTIELTDPDTPENDRGSSLMRMLLLRQTEQRVAETDFGDVVSTQPSARWAFSAAVCLAILVLPFFMAGSNYGLLMARFFAPWRNLERAASLRFEIDPGDATIARGSDVEIVATPFWLDPEESDARMQVWLNWENVVGSSDSRRMLWDNQREAYVAIVPHVFQSFNFNVSAERARTRDFHIEAVEAPVITEFRLTVEPPAYTGRPVEVVHAGVRDVWVFERSRLLFDVQFNKPLEEVTLDWVAAVAADTAESGNELVLTTPFILAPDGLSATAEWLAEQDGEFAVAASDAHGLGNDPFLRELRIITDGPPSIAYTDDETDTAARPDDIVPVPVFASDDVGVAELELHYEVVTGGEGSGVLTADATVLGTTTIEHEFRLDLDPLGLTDGAIVSIRSRAADERPVPGPNEVWTDSELIIIDSNADPYGHRAVAERQRQMRELLTALREETAGNRDAVNELHEEAVADQRQQLEFDRNDEVAALAAQQHDLAERAEQLAALFDMHPIFANLSDQTRGVARNELTAAENSMRRAESAPLAEKSEEFQQGASQLDSAVAELEDLEQQFDELAELEQDLLELRRLADQTNRLAESVADYQERQQQQTPPGTTPEQQSRNSDALESERAELQSDHQRLTDDLDQVLDRRPELLDAALQHQLDQLDDLTRRANELADSEQSLADSLQSEADGAPPSTPTLEEQQRELIERAAEIASDPGLQPSESVDPLDLERLRESLAALEDGDLEEAQQRLDEAAEALADLQEQFARNETLSEDPQQAARELAERQREIEEQLSNDPDSSENRDAAARAQAAVQAATAQLPVPEHAREEQQRAAEAAAETLQNIGVDDPQQAVEAASEAQEALEQLAEQIGTPEERRERALEELQRLREEQLELANQVDEARQQQADGVSPQETAAALQELAPQQEQLAQELGELDTPGAESARQSAAEQSQAATQELQSGQSDSAQQAQANADQALADLQQELQDEATASETVERLQREQRAISEAAEQAVADEDPSDLTQQAARQQEVADELAQLDAPAAASERQQGQQAAEEAAQALRESAENPARGEDALAAAESTEQALQQLAEQLNSQGRPASATDSEAVESPTPAQPSPAEQLSEALEALAQEQRELSEELAAAPMNQGEEPPGSPSPAASNPNEAAPSDLLAEQSQLTQDAAELALETAQQRGPDSQAAEQAQEFAQQAGQAAQETATGQPAEAAESARQAAETAQQSAESLRTPTPGEGEAQPELAARAEELAQRQQGLAEQLQQAAESPEARRALQEQGQQRLAQATEQLEQELQEVAEQLAAEPLERGSEAQNAASSQQASQQAQEQMQSAQSQIENQQLSQAAESASEAAESLRQAAQQAQGQQPGQSQEGQPQEGQTQAGQPQEGQPQEGQPQGEGQQGQPGQGEGRSPVPGQVGQQVAQASQQLRQAGEQLGQETSSQQGDPMEGTEPGEGQGESSGQPGENGEPRTPGSETPSPQSGESPGEQSSAESLRQAAQALQNAAESLQPSMAQSGQRQPGQQMPNRGSNQPPSPGNPNDSGESGGGTNQGVNLAELEMQLQELSTRRWGELPGTLQTELRESSQRRPDGDYSRLIRLYFEDVARSRPPSDRETLRRDVENDK